MDTPGTPLVILYAGRVLLVVIVLGPAPSAFSLEHGCWCGGIVCVCRVCNRSFDWEMGTNVTESEEIATAFGGWENIVCWSQWSERARAR